MTVCSCTSQRPYATGEGIVICDGCGERVAPPSPQNILVELAEMRHEISRIRQALDQVSDSVAVPQMITADELAERLRMSKSWIYLHAEDLGGRKINGALRFDPRIAIERSAPRPFRERGKTCS